MGLREVWGRILKGSVGVFLIGAFLAQAHAQSGQQNSLKIRAVQLDLARQKENLDYIRSFIDLSAKYGYNTLVLYLEGRIKTNSFPDLDAAHSYTPEQMQNVVRYAQEKGMEVIPVVPTLGHTEMFLRSPGLRKLAELDGGIEGRFGQDIYRTVCPSRKETCDFFARYLAEVAAIFPSRYFHAGLDESWDLGFCDECRRRTEKDGRSDLLFAEYVRRIHGILAGLGKTMLMWDDMFELYPTALEHIPRDIIMCTWCYDPSVTVPVAHFLHQKREDVFGKYDRMGFQYLFCPRELHPANSASLTRYARQHKPLGGLLTTWETTSCPLPGHYPAIAFAGKLWSGERIADHEDPLLRQVIEELAGRDETMIACLMTYYGLRSAWYTPMIGYCRGEVTHREEEQARTERLVYEMLKQRTAENNPVVSNVLYDLRERLWRFQVRKHLMELVLRRAAGEDAPADSRPIFQELDEVRENRLREWRSLRAGIPVEGLFDGFSTLHEATEKNITLLRAANNFLVVRFFMPEPTVAPKLRIIARDSHGGTAILSEGSFKPPFEDATYYDFVFPCKEPPVSVRLEVRGYGGQGVCFAKVVGGGKLLEPVAVRGVEGAVASPEHVLTDDLRWTYLGAGFIRDGFVVNDARKLVHAIEIVFDDGNH